MNAFDRLTLIRMAHRRVIETARDMETSYRVDVNRAYTEAVHDLVKLLLHYDRAAYEQAAKHTSEEYHQDHKKYSRAARSVRHPELAQKFQEEFRRKWQTPGVYYTRLMGRFLVLAPKPELQGSPLTVH